MRRRVRRVANAEGHWRSVFYLRADLHRRGIGKRLLEHLVATARDIGADSLHVPSSRNAVAFYEAAGFAVDAEQPDAAIEMTWMAMPLRGRPGEQVT